MGAGPPRGIDTAVYRNFFSEAFVKGMGDDDISLLPPSPERR